MDCQVYRTVLHPKMKEFPDESVTVFLFSLLIESKFT